MASLDEARRNQIIHATFNAIVDKGFNAVTLQDIADYAGVSKGVTSYYFKNKDDVFLNLLEWLTQRINHNERIAVEAQEDPVKKLTAYIHAVFVSPEENRRFYRVYLDFLAQGSRDERYRKINALFYEKCWSIGRDIIALGNKRQVFAISNIDGASMEIRALIDGNLIQWLMRDDDDLHSLYRSMCLDTVLRYLSVRS